MKLNKIVSLLILLGIDAIVFRNWFLAPEIIGGDWQYLFPEMLSNYFFFPLSWDPANGNGIGGISPIYPLNIYNNFTIFLANYLQIQWIIIYKIFWFGLFIALSILSSTALLKSTVLHVTNWQLVLTGVIFTTNTYILMIVGGGQMGVALAYSVAPLVLSRFIKLIDFINDQSTQFKIQNYNSKFKITSQNLKLSILAGLILAIQIMFDPRIAYITMLIVGGYYIFSYEWAKKDIRSTLYSLMTNAAIPIGIAILFHASWMLPMILFRQNLIGDLGQAYTGIGIVRFLSFAHFSDALALLHPNWPENLFGKMYFMRPEFLFLPILAYSSILFLQKSNRITIYYFVFLGLLGSFLAKGANEPFGEVYIWLFEHVPGFILFRDSTKFYLMIALAYSILIPFSIFSIYSWIKSKINSSAGRQKSKTHINNQIFYISYVFLLFAILYLIFLIRPAVLGQLGGTFRKHEVPYEYIVLKDFLHNQPDFFRTLWIPSGVRFNYFSNKHVVIGSEKFFGTKDITLISKKLSSAETKTYLQALGIKYIIVPFDSMGEIFVKDRKYDEEKYNEIITRLTTNQWLKRLHDFGRIAVFEVPDPKDRFWLSGNGTITYKMINPVEYDLTVSATKPQSLIFSENYHRSWIATSGNTNFASKKTEFGLNSFNVPLMENNSIKITFAQQKYYEYGQAISLVTLFGVVIAVFVSQKKKV